MFRFIDLYLLEWVSKKPAERKPLLFRGARQVGKTYAARNLGKKFKYYVEVNFEKTPRLIQIFEKDLDPARIIQILSAELKTPIIPSETLIFLDEIQEAPRALIALRYFFEEMPELHVIAAGSLLNLAIEQVGVPVGRISFFHIYPMSWLEYLLAMGRDKMVEILLSHGIQNPIDDFLHDSLLELLSEYIAIGGMPAVVQSWQEKRDLKLCSEIHHSIIQNYRNDFPKYARKAQIKYVELIFEQIPLQLGNKFVFREVPGEYRKRELLPALELLIKSDLAHAIYHSSGQGLPLGAQIDLNKFKVLALDIGIAQAMLGLKLTDWFIQSNNTLINKGAIVESFIGQELLVYRDPYQMKDLYYWHRETRNSQAEIDYLIQCNTHIIPIEVKSDKGRTLKSISLFLENHSKIKEGVRFSTHPFSEYDRILSYPLYAVATFLKDNSDLQDLILKKFNIGF